jgi:superfamily II DNA/RNA helicase
MTQPATGRGRASSRRLTQPSTSSSGTRRRAGRPSAGSTPRSTGTPTRAARPTRTAQSELEAALAASVADARPDVDSFAALGVPPLLVEALRRRGVERPFAIQTRALPDALEGRDVLGRAATGSGKTLAFGLPMLARLAGRDSDLTGRTGVDAASRREVRRTPGAPRALVLVPSRELALQVRTALTPLADMLGLRVSSVVGGVGYGAQIDALARGVDLLVATPGRLVDLIERADCRLDQIEITALDEADYMADLGFLPVVTRLLAMTPPGGQRLLFSATLDRGVAGLVEQFLTRPAVHAVAPATAAVAGMTHHVFVVERDHKIEIAAEVAARPARTLFFVRTKHGADRLAKQLGRAGVDAAALHGNLAQNARQRVMAAFVDGRTRVLVATDVAARGLHVDGVDLVVHFDPPTDHKDYLHRSGRTARASSTGTVVAFVQPDQVNDVRKLHLEARVQAVTEKVAPGHAAVQKLATSGEPVVVTAAAEPARTGTTPGRRRPARNRRERLSR